MEAAHLEAASEYSRETDWNLEIVRIAFMPNQSFIFKEEQGASSVTVL